MKKILITVFILACLLGLVGCDPATSGFDTDTLLSNTVKIELFSYENNNPESIRLSGKETPVFDFTKATFIAALDEPRIEDVVKDIAEQELILWDRTLNEPIGKTLILYQNDGRMIVLFGCVYKQNFRLTRYYGHCIVFDENGVFVEYLGDIDSNYVDTLAARYFE